VSSVTPLVDKIRLVRAGLGRDRQFGTRFGDRAYAFEEPVTELVPPSCALH
jgi:hypothetical protein